MKMSIARALKERKRIIGEMNTIRSRINANNMVQLTSKVNEDGTCIPPTQDDFNAKRKLDPEKLMEEWYSLRQKLISIKAKLHAANNGVIEKLIMLSEFKAELSILESMPGYTNTKEFYTEKFMKFINVKFDDAYITSKMDELRKQINELQDEIDEYNATHYIELED